VRYWAKDWSLLVRRIAKAQHDQGTAGAELTFSEYHRQIALGHIPMPVLDRREYHPLLLTSDEDALDSVWLRVRHIVSPGRHIEPALRRALAIACRAVNLRVVMDGYADAGGELAALNLEVEKLQWEAKARQVRPRALSDYQSVPVLPFRNSHPMRSWARRWPAAKS
jgi:hypothetical protein